MRKMEKKKKCEQWTLNMKHNSKYNATDVRGSWGIKGDLWESGGNTDIFALF